jgi:hypothetical protein
VFTPPSLLCFNDFANKYRRVLLSSWPKSVATFPANQPD